ncbi:hypothetical protein AbraIFM66951_011928 [Aspergillus brasiliensis]|uniref:Amidohydrolase-related domain-containing protein n=1 Tax=Aspergillus brasiliensis TaxID=319629 RepID=A0A9W5YZ34_9EURO|nr:hypothetical protein AbraCBS73388_011648 [Aspergillus brasiliensis]GKZ48170.1 hypothetical protein AbraIFM66951_011928 [Aspergillus brasiliensis]
MTTPILPSDSWDCHLHVLDPVRFPFKPNRAYTSPPALLESMVQHRHTDRLMLVQASIEDGYTGLLAHLIECQHRYSSLVIRGTICYDQTLLKLTKKEFDYLHHAGVRCIRIHGVYSEGSKRVEYVLDQLRQLSASYGIRELGWIISAQLPLRTWASLKPFILDNDTLNNVILIADHVGCTKPTDIDSVEFRDFLDMIGAGKLYVKIGALYRRSPNDFRQMKAIVQAVALKAPDRLLWGSDWPHVVTGVEKKCIGSVEAELLALREWLSETEWRQMLVDNPQLLFDREWS